jgi:hypothetical protein
MEYQSAHELPFPLSATASTRSSRVGTSSGTSGYRMRPEPRRDYGPGTARGTGASGVSG